MGYNNNNWGTIKPGKTVKTGIIWSPFNGNNTGGSDQGAQVNLAFPQTGGAALISSNQTKSLNLDGSVAYLLTVTSTADDADGVDNTVEFGLQGGGF